jgi:hypothetical protein
MAKDKRFKSAFLALRSDLRLKPSLIGPASYEAEVEVRYTDTCNFWSSQTESSSRIYFLEGK